MDVQEIIVYAAVAAAVLIALWRFVRNRKAGRRYCDGCPSSHLCQSCDRKERKRE